MYCVMCFSFTLLQNYYCYCYYYCIHLTVFFQDSLDKPAPKGKTFWILLEQEMMGGSGSVTLVIICCKLYLYHNVWPLI